MESETLVVQFRCNLMRKGMRLDAVTRVGGESNLSFYIVTITYWMSLRVKNVLLSACQITRRSRAATAGLKMFSHTSFSSKGTRCWGWEMEWGKKKGSLSKHGKQADQFQP